MKYVDQILDYLAEALNPDEKDQFEKELLRNNELKNEFDSVLLIDKKLKEIYHIEISDNSDRLKIIREMLYDDDINRYGGPPESPGEIELIRKIRQSMDNPVSTRRNSGLDYRMIIAVISFAAIIIVGLIFFFHEPAPDKLFAQYFKPQKDMTLINLMESTRGNINPGIMLYYRGHFEESIEFLQPFLNKGDTTVDIKLFYLLSCMKINCDEDLTELLKLEPGENETGIEQAYLFYSGLYLLHNDNFEGASERLKYLLCRNNGYHSKAKRLLRKID